MCLTLHKIQTTLITDRGLLQATFTTIDGGYLVLPYKPNISLIHSILYNKLFAYICKFLYLYIIILADIYA